MEPTTIQTSLKIQYVTGPHTDEWDMRGDKFKGSEQGDEHRTLFEIDPCPAELIFAMENEDSRKLIETFVSHIAPSKLQDIQGALGVNGVIIARLYDGAEH